MRSLLFFFTVLFFSAAAFAQSNSTPNADSIPNGSFEYWTGGIPDGWTSNPSLMFQTYFEHSGFFGAEGIVAIDNDTAPTLSIEFPIHYRPGIFDGYYQLTSIGGDEILIFATILSKGSPGGEAMLVDTVSSLDWQVWNHFQLPFMYPSEEFPDSAFLLVTLQNPNGKLHNGTSFLLDDLSFLDTSADQFISVQENPALHSATTVYPNPVSTQTTLHVTLANSGYTSISIVNALGNEVARVFAGELGAGVHDLVWNAPASLAAGTYLCAVRSGEGFQTVPIVLTR